MSLLQQLTACLTKHPNDLEVHPSGVNGLMIHCTKDDRTYFVFLGGAK